MTRSVARAVVASSALVMPAVAHGQSDRGTEYRMELGTGPSSLFDGAFMFGGAARVRLDAHLMSLSVKHAAEALFRLDGGTVDQTSAIGLMYGRAWVQPRPPADSWVETHRATGRAVSRMASISTGLAYVSNVRRGEVYPGSGWFEVNRSPDRKTHTLAIPLEGQVGFFIGAFGLSLGAATYLGGPDSFSYLSLNLMARQPRAR